MNIIAAKVKTSKLAIAAIVSSILTILCVIVYFDHFEFYDGLTHVFFPHLIWPLSEFQREYFFRTFLFLMVITVLLGVSAIAVVSLNSKKYKGYILAIASLVLILITIAASIGIALANFTGFGF